MLQDRRELKLQAISEKRNVRRRGEERVLVQEEKEEMWWSSKTRRQEETKCDVSGSFGTLGRCFFSDGEALLEEARAPSEN